MLANVVFFRTELPYCGHVISEGGVATDPKKIAKLADWRVPKDASEVRQFLGFAGYYRRFVKNFSQIAKPLYDLIGAAPRKRGRKKIIPSQPDFSWGETEQQAFETLKLALTSPPLLGYARTDSPFIL